MRKRKKGRKFSRKTGPRRALLRSLARELVLRGRIKTTEVKAKETSRFVEKFVTRAKKGDLAARRHLLRFFEKTAAKKLMEEIAPRFQGRQGGYTRVIKLGPRKSDSAKMAMIEFVSD